VGDGSGGAGRSASGGRQVGGDSLAAGVTHESGARQGKTPTFLETRGGGHVLSNRLLRVLPWPRNVRPRESSDKIGTFGWAYAFLG
jgi:hypothetical protein